MYAQAAVKPNPLLRNGAYGIVMRGVQKCTRGCSSLRGRNRLPLCCIKLDTATDPACGAGALLLAFANECKRNHINYQTSVFFVAQDIDFLAGCMCYIQMSLLGCPGYVVIDDSILHPAQSYDEDGLIPKNSPNVWLTPMYFRDVWHWRRIFAQLDLITQTKERTHGKPDM